jgi:hypothetical protein
MSHSQRRETWEDFFALANRAQIPADFVTHRGDLHPQQRDAIEGIDLLEANP